MGLQINKKKQASLLEDGGPMSPCVALGLDVSTKLGWAAVHVNGVIARGEKHYEPDTVNRFARWACYSSFTEFLIGTYNPQIIVTEGYAFARNKMAALGELGGMVRWAIHESAIPVIEVSPSSLKKFVTGGGKAEKSAMMMHVLKQWGVETKTDNEADAVGLAMIGATYLGNRKAKNQAQLEVCGILKKGFRPI